MAQRIAQCDNFRSPETKLLLAIENFIFEDDGLFYDACMIAFRKRDTTNQSFGPIFFLNLNLQHRVLVPSVIYPILDAAMKNGDALDQTGGEMLREHFLNDNRYSDKDWFVCAGSAFDRSTQITNVLQDNAAQIKFTV